MTIGGVVAVVLLASVLTWALWPAPAPEPRARQYRDVTACLLTDGRGVTGPGAAPIWAGLQAASQQTHGQVRYLAVAGAQTVGNAQGFAGTLLLGRCAVIAAAPGIADGAVRAIAAQHPGQRFLVVGGAEPESTNVSRVTDAQISAAVVERLTSGS